MDVPWQDAGHHGRSTRVEGKKSEEVIPVESTMRCHSQSTRGTRYAKLCEAMRELLRKVLMGFANGVAKSCVAKSY